jgi:hypothetical protein
MISKVNNNASGITSVSGLNSETESVKSSQPQSEAVNISPSSTESPEFAAEGKSVMDLRAGLTQKALSDALQTGEQQKSQSYFADLLVSQATDIAKQGKGAGGNQDSEASAGWDIKRPKGA